MSDGIEFGDVQHQEPDQALRPDENPQWAVVSVGELDHRDIPVYVDIDVMRDMEAHAQTDTSVELGGVMLGYQYHDSEGNPFILVTDSLRAEHFEATKGSFKFTHETWQSISRRRDSYPEGIQMVGWYHTHPDWGVFLSGMDLFICNNFFNRPLDIALVIDPCRDERGWFYWDVENPGRTRQSTGFYLFGSRFRQQEIECFAELYQGNSFMAADPRYQSMGSPGGQSIVNIHDHRTPMQNVVMMGMLTVQMLVLAIIAWKLLAPNDQGDKQLAQIEDKVDSITRTNDRNIRNEATLEVLDKVLEKQGNGKDLASELANTKIALEKSNLDREAVYDQRKALSRANNKLDSDLEKEKKRIKEYKDNASELRSKISKLEKQKGNPTPAWLLLCGGMLVCAVGVGAGFLFRSYFVADEDELKENGSYGKREETDELPFRPDEHQQKMDDDGGIALIQEPEQTDKDQES